jgi:accessory Sec system protein Asp3
VSNAKLQRLATIQWGLVNSAPGLFGTHLTYHPNGSVNLVNPLMPSALIIQRWGSSANYQSERQTPALPLLHGGRTYCLKPDMTTSPDNTAFFTVQFRDRFDDLISEQFLYPPEFQFTLPAEGQNYSIALMSAGCDEITFSSFDLCEVNDG